MPPDTPPDILLTTLNAKYHHASFGLRYLYANMGDLKPQAKIQEFTINQSVIEIAEAILSQQPRILTLGVYIWNVSLTTQLVDMLKKVAPEMLIILGGPEVSYEYDQQPICVQADYVVTGEGDVSLPELCRKLLVGSRPLNKIIEGEQADLTRIALPYDEYTDEDIQNRTVYVEASRGCPFSCEFCLSSLDRAVNQVPLDQFLTEMQKLYDRGLRQFKFVDRTFNLNLKISRAILAFFLEKFQAGEQDLFIHFEMIPDRLPESLREIIAQFPGGALQFEVGIQSFNPQVQDTISRRQDNEKTAENLTWLHEETGVHIHADLIVGLPGETLESFAAGFNKLFALKPQEIQVGILKRLRGTPIIQHDDPHQMVYSSSPPYEVLKTGAMSFEEIADMRRFARYWDMIANSGRFTHLMPLILSKNAFEDFKALSGYLWQETGRTHGINLTRLFELLFRYLCESANYPSSSSLSSSHSPDSIAAIANKLWLDYQACGRHDMPSYLKPFDLPRQLSPKKTDTLIRPKRQQQHLA